VPVPELLATLVLGAGFAAVGEAILRRSARSLADANEAMLVGMGVCAAALFPLTLLLPGKALLAEGFLLAAALAYAAGRRFLRKTDRPSGRPRRRLDPVTGLVLGGVALVAAGFAALNFRYTFFWDGMLIWATKAQLLSHAGSLTREWFPGDTYDLRHLAYPALVPLAESLLGLVRDGFAFDEVKPLFFLFYLSLLVGSYASVRHVLSSRAAAVTALLVCLVPEISTGSAAGGYADIPQAAAIAGVVAAALGGRRDALPWLIGTLTTVKSEGMIYAGVACGAIVLYEILERGARGLRRLASAQSAIGILAAFVVLRLAYVRWIDAPQEIYSGSLGSALARVPHVARLCAAEMFDPRHWGLFWPAFFASAAVLIAVGSSRERALVWSVAFGLVLLAVPFLFTTWPLELHVSQAYARISAQLVPAAAASIVLGYAKLRSRLVLEAPEPGDFRLPAGGRS